MRPTAKGATHPRARIGPIVPSVNTLTEPQFNRYMPSDVEVHVTRTRIEVSKSLAEQLSKILESASLLADCESDLIVYHCTGISMMSGNEAEVAAVQAIREATGRPSTSAAAAVVAALKVLGARKVVLVTPYPQAINDLAIRFLAADGIEVLRDRALDLPVPDGMRDTLPEIWLNTTLEMRDSQADAYFLSCNNIQSLAVIEALEQRLGMPVVASNQASLWYSLRLCGIDDRIPELGYLASLPLATPC